MNASLDYREHAPAPPLRPYLRCLWTLRGAGPGSPQLIVPDGCMEMVLNFGAPFEQLDPPPNGPRQPLVLVVGEVRRPVGIRPTGRIDLLGVRFAPGAAPVFFDAPAAELVDGMTDDAAVSGALRREGLGPARDADPDERVQLLEAALARRLGRGREDELVGRAAAILARGHGGTPIQSLSNILGVHRRQLERRFRAAVGVAPKALAQVLRFRRVLRAIEDVEVDWAGVAVDSGYCDQSHLIRDFKRFTGLPPRAYLRADHPLTVLFDGSVGGSR